MTPAVDDDGLVCGFELGPVAPCGPEILREDDGGRARWLHLDLSNARARKRLHDRAPIPSAARAALLDFVLSVVTTTLLPITLITGIFGMNVGGLPWVESEAGSYWVMFIIICAVITTLWVLRSRRVL